MTGEPEIREGQRWRHRYDSYRTLVVDHVREEHGETMVYPLRNTSRRRQAISAKTLRRSYRLEREAA